jgi:hypothetical protein
MWKWKMVTLEIFWKDRADDKSEDTKLLINCSNQSLVAKLQSIGDAIRPNWYRSISLCWKKFREMYVYVCLFVCINCACMLVNMWKIIRAYTDNI